MQPVGTTKADCRLNRGWAKCATPAQDELDALIVSDVASSPASAGRRFNMNFRLDPLGGAQDAAFGFLGDRAKKVRPFAVRLLQRPAADI
jgi:hypothetical protein